MKIYLIYRNGLFGREEVKEENFVTAFKNKIAWLRPPLFKRVWNGSLLGVFM